MTGKLRSGRNVVYWGTGNGSPWFGDQRRATTSTTSSTVALDGDTGKIKGHFPIPSERVVGLGRDERADAVGFQDGHWLHDGLLTHSATGYLYWLGRHKTAAFLPT